ncbi:hypothetical protein JW897_00935 [Chromobacterium alkanivorans]|uniref:hypothetical protein n=1 Tax=Chromobacterium alkanivorans TaxID=1071719 RepID=UPI0019677CA5|nr:hypothetical protein [Chromobacterium alkanivorans]MBN3002290.1 hypothetical protein [Chromobacterium alkanivorans]
MHFVRLGAFLAATMITGPKHNLLQIRLGTGVQGTPTCECLPSHGECQHEPLIEEEIIAHVLEGTSEANSRLATSYTVSHIRYVQNDTKPEVVYGYLTLKIIEHLQAGGVFQESQNAS